MKLRRTSFNHLAVIGGRFGACGSSGASAAEPPAPFVGPLDDYATGLSGAWSVGRRLLSTYTGPLIRLRRLPDDAEADFTYDADGKLDTVAISNFVGPFDAFVVKVYDQTGGENELYQTTNNAQFKIVDAGALAVVNSRPMVFNWGGGNRFMMATAAQPAYTFMLVAHNGSTPVGGFGSLFKLPSGNSLHAFWDLGGSNWAVYDESFATHDMGAQTTWACHVLASDAAGGNDMLARSDATEINIANDTATLGQLEIGSSDTDTEFTEAVLFPAKLDVTTVTAVQAILKNWVLPSLALTLIATIDTAIAGQVPSTHKPIYSSQDHSTPAYTRNVSFWAHSYASAMTAISPWNSSGATQKAGVLVSPRHVLFAQHYTPSVSSTIRFVTTGDVVVTRTITAIENLTTRESYYPDISVALLDSDVPGTIEFARVLPDNFRDYLPSLTSPRLPVLVTNQDEEGLVMDMYEMPASITAPRSLLYLQNPTDATRQSFSELLTSGDSGAPFCWLIDSKLVLLGMATYANYGSGTSIVPFKAEIDAAMATLGGDYALTDIDLSSYLPG